MVWVSHWLLMRKLPPRIGRTCVRWPARAKVQSRLNPSVPHDPFGRPHPGSSGSSIGSIQAHRSTRPHVPWVDPIRCPATPTPNPHRHRPLPLIFTSLTGGAAPGHRHDECLCCQAAEAKQQQGCPHASPHSVCGLDGGETRESINNQRTTGGQIGARGLLPKEDTRGPRGQLELRPLPFPNEGPLASFHRRPGPPTPKLAAPPLLASPTGVFVSGDARALSMLPAGRREAAPKAPNPSRVRPSHQRAVQPTPPTRV